MNDTEFTHLIGYLEALYPKMEDMSTGIQDRWNQAILKYDFSDVSHAIDQWADNHQPNHAPTLDQILDILDVDMRAKVERKRNEEAAEFFQGKMFESKDHKPFALNAATICLHLATKQITTDEAIAYLEHLKKTDSNYRHDYHACIEQIQLSQKEIEVGRLAYAKWKEETRKAKAAPTEDSPAGLLFNWLKTKRQISS